MSVWYYVGEQNFKVIEGQSLPISATVTFHVDIPNSNNNAGYSYRDCILDRIDADGSGVVSKIRGIATRWPGAQAGETGADRLAKLQTGETHEVSETIRFSSAYLTPAERNAEVQARAIEMRDTLFAELQQKCEFSGYNNTVLG